MAIVVHKRPGEDEDRLIAKFRKAVQAKKLLTEIKDREFYKKPSEIKKERLKFFRKGRKKRKK